MATALTTIFGNEIRIYAQPRRMDRQYVGFPGAHGLIGMQMGSRGRQVVITGRLRATGNNYENARGNLQDDIDTIEEYLWMDADDYSFAGEIYDNTIFERFNLVPDGNGKVFHFNSEGVVFADFVCSLRQLI